MKHHLLVFLLLCSSFCGAQNLVPNPSFEDTVACPTGGGQVWKAEHWYVAEKTPDYFNECCTHPSFAVPDNLWGYRYPASGYSYCGFLAYSTIDTLYREKIGVKLSQSLQIGTRYFVSFKLSATVEENSSGASNKIGILFSNAQYTPAYLSATKDYCQIWTDSIITDTINWVQVYGSFIADSAYTYMTIGNFFTNAHTDTLRFWEPAPQTSYFLQSYYFIDDICVSQDSTECITSPVSIRALVESKRVVKIYPNPANSHFTVETETDEPSIIKFYTTDGTLFLTQNIPIGRQTININTTELNNGIYFLRLTTHNKNFSYKLIIHH